MSDSDDYFGPMPLAEGLEEVQKKIEEAELRLAFEKRTTEKPIIANKRSEWMIKVR